MQAVRVRPDRAAFSRQIAHLLLIGTVGLLIWAALPAMPPALPASISLPPTSLGVPASPLLEWRPVRVPLRTAPPSDPSPPAAVAQVGGEPNPPPLFQPDPAPAVQSDPGPLFRTVRWSALFAGPSREAASFTDIPPRSSLGVLESRPGWLLVSYGGDGDRRQPGTAWVPAMDVAPSDVSLETVVSTREATVWSGVEADAAAVASVPRLALLDSLGPGENGRVPVRLGFSDQVGEIRAWVDAAAVAAAGAFNGPHPWDRPFAFGETRFRLGMPYRTQLDGSAAAGANCGPASLGMILDSFGMNVATDRLRNQAHRFQGTFGPWTGFTLEALRSVAETYGLEGQDLMEGRRYRRWTLEDVRQHLRAGHPVIPQLRYRLMPGREWAAVNYDHYLVLTGVDGDDFLFSDPIPSGGQGEGRLTASQLLRAWSNSDAPMVALAIAGPR
jgi:hypothetical protein